MTNSFLICSRSPSAETHTPALTQAEIATVKSFLHDMGHHGTVVDLIEGGGGLDFSTSSDFITMTAENSRTLDDTGWS